MPSLREINPDLSKEWHPTNNAPLTPEDVTPGSNRKVWWICLKGHEWKAGINNRCYHRTGCPYCSGHRACIDNCLHTVNPSLAREWHPRKNGSLTPEDVTPGSSKKVWWICSEGHTWEAVVSYRNRGTGCPYCAGHAVGRDNCLANTNPKLARQWHPEKNGNLSPKDVTLCSTRKVWWICDRGHEWQAVISNRSRGRGCPFCANRAVHEDNSLHTSNPSLASEWHPGKNGRLTPRDVIPGSNRRVWWQCEKGHEWEAHIQSRSRGYGKCPHCRGRRKV